MFTHTIWRPFPLTTKRNVLRFATLIVGSGLSDWEWIAAKITLFYLRIGYFLVIVVI